MALIIPSLIAPLTIHCMCRNGNLYNFRIMMATTANYVLTYIYIYMCVYVYILIKLKKTINEF